MDCGTRQLQSTTFTFDVSIHEVFVTLAVGGCIVQSESGDVLEVEYLDSLIRSQRCDWLAFVPSLTSVFIDSMTIPPSVKNVANVGEALPPGLCGRFFDRCERQVQWWNLWGPTECTTYATVQEVRRRDEGRSRVSIGRPCKHRAVYVLNDHCQPVAVDVPGELYVGGPGVAKGYRGQSLPGDAFVQRSVGGKTQLLYRTGDIGRWRRDGTLDFLGRSDNQVKIRGLRIELGEIEVVMSQVESVREAVAVALPTPGAAGGTQLVAYVAPSSADRCVRGGVATDEQRQDRSEGFAGTAT